MKSRGGGTHEHSKLASVTNSLIAIFCFRLFLFLFLFGMGNSRVTNIMKYGRIRVGPISIIHLLDAKRWMYDLTRKERIREKGGEGREVAGGD